jgi:5-methylcytosine-specific restriction enzyme A
MGVCRGRFLQVVAFSAGAGGLCLTERPAGRACLTFIPVWYLRVAWLNTGGVNSKVTAKYFTGLHSLYTMQTFLLTWNPQKWPWEDLQESIDEVARRGFSEFTWSCGNSKRIVKGDRVFLLRQGVEPRGIVASGRAVSASFEEIHWREEKARRGRTTRYVKVRWEVLLNPDSESVFPREWLNVPPLSDVNWNTQISGINIPDQVASVLEERWDEFLRSRRTGARGFDADDISSDEILNPEEYWEGAVQQIWVNRYERNGEARRKCLEHYGSDCYICEFNFERIYGESSGNFMHVHHVKPLSETNEKYQLDPVKDLRPVCPNCHAVIHKKSPPCSIEEMIELLHGRG